MSVEGISAGLSARLIETERSRRFSSLSSRHPVLCFNGGDLEARIPLRAASLNIQWTVEGVFRPVNAAFSVKSWGLLCQQCLDARALVGAVNLGAIGARSAVQLVDNAIAGVEAVVA